MTIYSRDELAVPLRLLSLVYADIRAGTFEPDASRSGHWRPERPAAPSPAPSSLPAASAAGSGSDSSSASSGTASSVDTVAPDAQADLDEDMCGYVYNPRTRIVHLNFDGMKLGCGKDMPLRGVLSVTWPVGAETACSRCFKR